jgi:hypothetical protein
VNTWGTSWGDCWGDTWGADDTVPPIISSGGSRRRDPMRIDDEDIEFLLQIVAAAIAAGAIH